MILLESSAPTNVVHFVPADTGPAYWGPGDRYTFLVTSAQSGGAYFIMEGTVPPGGGPPPHIHHREEEAFYVLAGELTFVAGDQVIQARTGDFVHIPRGTVHHFRNTGTRVARMLVTFSPGGMEKFFEETLDPVTDRTAPAPDNQAAIIPRFLAAAPRHGLEMLPPGSGPLAA